MKKFLKITAVLLSLLIGLFGVSYALGIATRPKMLKPASLVWWPMEEEQFYAQNAWAASLKEGFKKNGYDLKLTTQQSDVPHLISSDIIIIAYPLNKNLVFPFNYLKKETKIYLWAWESPMWMNQPITHRDANRFTKIFTWRKDLVDNQKTFFVPQDTRLTKGIRFSKERSRKRILMVQIASNLYRDEQNIYQMRRDATLWWLKNHPGEYEFYGPGWDKLAVDLDKKLIPAFTASYKGFAPDKIKALSEAFFALAFENTRHPYYVSEKIYDVMKAGTVPVYLGAQNIEEFVPKACFINYADFQNDEELYAFLKLVTPERYQAYLNCIQDFLNSDKIDSLTGEAIAQSLLKEIFN